VDCVTVVGDRKLVVIICTYLTIGTKRKSVAAPRKKSCAKSKKKFGAIKLPKYLATDTLIKYSPMTDKAFVLGNGESRQGIKIADLKQHGKVYACNAVYRTEEPDALVAVDPKMVMEISETEYPVTHEVWSNYNGQFEKIERAKKYIKWFTPSLGWSSGPTALKLAADRKHSTIYILGFDYQGHPRGTNPNHYAYNNMFKNSRNYKSAGEQAIFYGNWMNQTKRILSDYPQIQFVRVVPKNAFKPQDLEFYTNFKHLDIEEFLNMHSLRVQP
jgi:hypothetical protein